MTTTGVACTSAGSDDAPEGDIAFAIELNRDWRLVIANADGSGDLTVLRYPTDWPVIDSAWSPDGKKIAYGDIDGVWVMNADGTGLQQVADKKYSSSPDIFFAWSPDGGRIALLDVKGLYVVDAGGTDRRLIVRCGLDCYGPVPPAWSPDGRKIAYGTSGESLQIYLVNADGTGERAFTRGNEPSWSPDGKQIAFARRPWPPYVLGSDGIERERPGEHAVYVINSDGSGERRLGRGDDPSWSPDGKQIAFYRKQFVHVINSDGSGERRLGRGEHLSWSPSGSHIAVSRDFREPSLTAPETSIWVMNDGSRERQIWPRRGLCECGSPEWQPD